MNAYRGSWTAVFGTLTVGGDATAALTNPLPLALGYHAGGRVATVLNIEGTRMSGSYFTVDCGQVTRGSILLTKE